MNDVPLLVDDHLLLSVLLGREPAELRPRGALISTTGLWYHRLCRALADDSVTGVMSRQLGSLDPSRARAATRATIELPPAIGLLSLRSLGWPMAELLASGMRLNLLSLEALAAAESLGAALCLADTDDNPPLREAASHRGVAVRTVAA